MDPPTGALLDPSDTTLVAVEPISPQTEGDGSRGTWKPGKLEADETGSRWNWKPERALV